MTPAAFAQLLETIKDILFWVGIFWLLVYGYFVLFHKGIPNIRTAPAIRKKVIELLLTDATSRENYIVVDIGSGNGLFTREIARAMPNAKIIGIEIAAHSVLWARWLARRAKLSNLEYRRMDFLNYNFGEANAAVMYLIPDVLTLLGKKLHAEAQAHTLIISNKFPLGAGWQPDTVINTQTLYLHQREIYVYRKP